VRAVRFHPDARTELLAATRFYRAEAAGLGRALASEVRWALERISEFPESGSPEGEGWTGGTRLDGACLLDACARAASPTSERYPACA